MRSGEVGWIVYLVGLPFAHLLCAPFLPGLDIWHVQAAWAHAGLLGLVVCWLWRGGTPLANPTLALWVGWVALSWVWRWQGSLMATQTYPLPLLMGFVHLLALVAFYCTATAMWTAKTVERLLTALAWMSWVLLAYCALQLMNLDQFFNSAEYTEPDQLVGTIGNPTHLATHLALLLPIIVSQRGHWWKVCGGLTFGVILLTRSVSGTLAALVALAIVWGVRRPWRTLAGVGVVGSLFAWVCRATVANTSGRIPAWNAFWDVFIQRPITGYGAGFVMDLSQHTTHDSPIFHWRHAHQEYLQVAMEQGLIGLALVLALLWATLRAYTRAHPSPTRNALGAVLGAFLVSALVSYPAHLWVTGSLGLLAYCGLHVLAAETA